MGLLAGRYKLIAELGSGGFGQTFLAQDVLTQDGLASDGLTCVIKQFKPTNQETQFLAIARRLFDTEVETLRKLGQHDQIPALLNFFEEENEFYLVQEYVDGQTLSEEFASREPYSEAEAIDLLKDVLSILEFVHSQHVIHRDIKPGNLIRRRSDGKIVLIDFGAVKEIQTQILQQSGQSSFTIGIGTQGYTPAEQLAGKPRYCSDLYALGMTAIHALTGYQPSVLPEDPDTGELLWQSEANVNLGLAIVLNRMVRLQARERYQSAREVNQALQHLAELPTELTSIPSILLPSDELESAEDAIETTLATPLRRRWRGVAIASLAVAGLVLGVRQMGGLEPLELAAFDRMVRLQPQMPPDARLTLVEITEADLQQLQRTTPTDRSLAQAIAKLQKHQPAVIGLDLHRDIPQNPGQAELAQQLQADNLVAITNLGTSNTDRIPPPSGVPSDRVGFNDVPLDPDNVARRALLFASPSEDSATYFAFALRVALQYLDRQGIKSQSGESNYLRLGETTFVPLRSNSGGYQQADAAGYQILLRYRAIEAVAHRLTLTDVLSDRVDPAQITNQIVLIGTTAPSAKDLFTTPYSAGRSNDFQMAGVMLHAQIVSQILDSATEQQALYWFWPEAIETVWIVVWAGVGGAIAIWLRHPLKLAAGTGLALGTIAAVSWGLLLDRGWIPIAAPAIALIAAEAAAVIYMNYQTQQAVRDKLLV